jgi:hypothetical protein
MEEMKVHCPSREFAYLFELAGQTNGAFVFGSPTSKF